MIRKLSKCLIHPRSTTNESPASLVAVVERPAGRRSAMNDSHPVFHERLRFETPSEGDLYEKLKAYQWNASTEIDWSRPIRNFSEEAYAAVRGHFSREDYDRLRGQQRAFTFTQLF